MLACNTEHNKKILCSVITYIKNNDILHDSYDKYFLILNNTHITSVYNILKEVVLDDICNSYGIPTIDKYDIGDNIKIHIVEIDAESG